MNYLVGLAFAVSRVVAIDPLLQNGRRLEHDHATQRNRHLGAPIAVSRGAVRDVPLVCARYLRPWNNFSRNRLDLPWGHPVLTGTIEYSGHSRFNPSRISHSGLLEGLDLRFTHCRRGAAGRHRDVGRIDGVTKSRSGSNVFFLVGGALADLIMLTLFS